MNSLTSYFTQECIDLFEVFRKHYPKLASKFDPFLGNVYVEFNYEDGITKETLNEDIKSLLQPYKHEIVDFLKKYGIDNDGDWYFFIEVGYADEDGILYGGFGVSTLEDNQPECTYSHKHCVNHEDGEYIMFDFDWLQEV